VGDAVSTGIGVVIPIFGDLKAWRPRAARAAASAAAAGADQVEVVEASTLHDARNTGLARLGQDWVVHLDADDVMDPGYLGKARASISASPGVDVHVPYVRYWRGNVAGDRSQLTVSGHSHECRQECLPSGNYVVVGAPARVQLLQDIGAWRDWPIYEDWDLWLRAHLTGGVFAWFPGTYDAYRRPGSRNRAGRQVGTTVHRQIAASCGVS